MRSSAADRGRLTSDQPGHPTRRQSTVWYGTIQRLGHMFFQYWGGGYCVLGRENVPADLGGFLIANHCSFADPLLLQVSLTQRLLVGPGKLELFQSPILGPVLRRMGGFPVRRDGTDFEAARALADLHREGRLVLIFPESHRSSSGDLQPFSPDIARLAIKLKVPLVPAGISGTRAMMPPGVSIPRRRVPVAVAFGAPFELAEYYDRRLTPDMVKCGARLMEERVQELAARAAEARTSRHVE